MNIAQNFQADAPYSPGTVVQVGGSNDVTAATPGSTSIAGVVTAEPGILLNPDLTGENVVAVAVHGTVECGVIGIVAQGDQLIISQSGDLESVANYAAIQNWVLSVGTVVGIALESTPGPHSVIKVLLTSA
jgi:hypothetical protein